MPLPYDGTMSLNSSFSPFHDIQLSNACSTMTLWCLAAKTNMAVLYKADAKVSIWNARHWVCASFPCMMLKLSAKAGHMLPL